MPYELSMGDDGILQVTFIGDLTDKDAKAYREEIKSFFEATTEAKPLLFLIDSSRMDKMSAKFRKTGVEILRDSRMGKTAGVGGSRYVRVLTSFIMKATGRDVFRFFDSEEEALAWLKAKS
jgi:hypothetical protein